MNQANQAMVALCGVDGVLAKHTSGANGEQKGKSNANTAHSATLRQKSRVVKYRFHEIFVANSVVYVLLLSVKIIHTIWTNIFS